MSPQEFKELLLSHHPDRPCFNDDVVILFNRRICAGCLFAYPTALAVLLFLHPSGYSSIIIALLLAGLSQIRRLVKDPIIQNFFRFIAGIALGFGLGGIYWAILYQQWYMVILLISGAGAYLLFKAQSIKHKLESANNPE